MNVEFKIQKATLISLVIFPGILINASLSYRYFTVLRANLYFPVNSLIRLFIRIEVYKCNCVRFIYKLVVL
ncbi:hypothetical protein ACVWYG_003667 [Pedobacter sp. UYEF25]